MAGKFDQEAQMVIKTLKERGTSPSSVARSLGVTEGAVRYHPSPRPVSTLLTRRLHISRWLRFLAPLCLLTLLFGTWPLIVREREGTRVKGPGAPPVAPKPRSGDRHDREHPSDLDFTDGQAALYDEAFDFYDPVVVTLRDGLSAVVGLAFDGIGDRVFMSLLQNSRWSDPVWITEEPRPCLSPTAIRSGKDEMLIVWPEQIDGTWDLQACLFSCGAGLGSHERVTHGLGQNCQPALAVSADGVAHVAWAGLQGGRWDVFLSHRIEGGWTAPERLTDSSEADFEPTLGLAPDGILWACWTGQRSQGDFFGTFLRPVTPELGRVSMLPKHRVESSPTLLETPDGLWLTRTRHSIVLKQIGDLTMPADDRWADKTFVITKLRPDGLGEETELRLTSNTKSGSTVGRATPIALPDGQIWLFYGETARSKELFRAFQTRVVRIGSEGVSHPLQLHPNLFTSGAAPSVDRNPRGSRIILASTVYADTRLARLRERTWIDLTSLLPSLLPAPSPPPIFAPPPADTLASPLPFKVAFRGFPTSSRSVKSC